MLALTENVTEIVKKLSRGGPGDLRPPHRHRGRRGVPVREPRRPRRDRRRVIEQDGATVYVDAPAAEILADKVLDGGVDEEGNIQFALGQQA